MLTGKPPFARENAMATMFAVVEDMLPPLKKFGHYMFRLPYLLFPGGFNPLKREVKVDFMDAIHFQRGIQNFHCRDFEVEINVPRVGDKMDFQLIQKAWWAGMDYVNKHKDIIDMALEMRLCKGS